MKSNQTKRQESARPGEVDIYLHFQLMKQTADDFTRRGIAGGSVITASVFSATGGVLNE